MRSLESERLVEAEVETGRLPPRAQVEPHGHPALHDDAVSDAKVREQAVKVLVAASHGPGAHPGDEPVQPELGVALHVVSLQVHPAKLEQRIDDGAVPVATLPVSPQ